MALYTNDVGTYFDERLLAHIKHRQNDLVRSTLRNTDPRNLISSSAATLLHYAAEYGNEEIVRYLVRSGSDVDAQNQLKETPLMLALEGHFKRTIGILLGANADVYVLDIYGKGVLGRLFDEAATKPTSESIVEMFLDRVATDERDDEFVASKLVEANCPIYRIVRLRRARVTRSSLEKGCRIDVREPRTHRTALHIAVEMLDLENVRVLLEHKADVDARDRRGRTPLSLLPSVFNLLEIIKILLSRGSALLQSDCALIPMHSVLVYGNKQAIWTYLQNNVDFGAILRMIVDRFLRACHHLNSVLNPTPTKK